MVPAGGEESRPPAIRSCLDSRSYCPDEPFELLELLDELFDGPFDEGMVYGP